jgi:hypothetical protein
MNPLKYRNAYKNAICSGKTYPKEADSKHLLGILLYFNTLMIIQNSSGLVGKQTNKKE